METRNTKIFFLLFLLFLLVAALRIHFTLSLPAYSTPDSYFHERIITRILQEHTLPFSDTLSYGGRDLVYAPFFALLMSILSLGSSFLLNILPQFFLSSIVFLSYLLCYQTCKNTWASLAGAAITSFLPLFLWETTNTLSPDSLFLPLLFLSFYSFLTIETKTSLWIFIISVFVLILTSPHAYILLLSLVFYFLIEAGGALTPSRLEKEAALLTLFSVILFSLILYKRAFLSHGFGTIWQNLPSTLLAEQFRALTGVDLLLSTGALPLLLGGFGLYIGISKEKNKSVYLISGFILASLSLLTLKLITITTGLLFLSLGLATLSSLALANLSQYTQHLRFSFFTKAFPAAALLLILGLAIIPSYTHLQRLQGVDPQTIQDLLFLKYEAPTNVVILGNLQEGHLITSISQHKNVLDTNFILAPKPVERLREADTIYTTWSQAKALEYLRHYNVSIIYLSEQTKNHYSINNLAYATLPCFTTQGRLIYVHC